MTRSATHHGCTVLRTKVVTASVMNLFTGEQTVTGQHTETGPCNTPLFTPAERITGICRSCAEGWTHPDNRPATAEEIRQLSERAA
jgi:hypothetical protein